MNSDYLTQKQAAEYCNLSTSTLQRAEKDPRDSRLLNPIRVRPSKTGHNRRVKVLYKKCNLDRYMAAHAKHPELGDGRIPIPGVPPTARRKPLKLETWAIWKKRLEAEQQARLERASQ